MPKTSIGLLSAAHDKLHADLHFLSVFFEENPAKYRSADWLLSDFDDAEWTVSLTHNFVLRWDLHVGASGCSLLDPQYRHLLTFFKTWLIVQTHPDATGYVLYAKASAYNKLRRTISLIDTLLLNADHLGVTEHGVHALSESTWRAVLHRIATSCRTSESAYQWGSNLRTHLLAIVDGEELSQLQALQADPLIGSPPPPRDEWTMDVTEEQLLQIRAALWLRGHYRSESNNRFQFLPNISAFAACIYRHTLGGAAARHALPVELCLGEIPRLVRERPAVPVTTDVSPRRGVKDVRQLIACIDHSNLLSEECDVSETDIGRLEALVPFLDLKPSLRFKSIPIEEGFTAIRRAVEIFLDLRDDLLLTYARLADSALVRGCTILDIAESGGITHFVTPKLLKLGVTDWTISPRYSESSRGTFFSDLRLNRGLLELMRVVQGAIQIAIGSVTARRSAELQSLKSGKALDADRNRLVFSVGKNNAGEFRELAARPIPPIAADMVGYLESLHAIAADALSLRQAELPLFAHLTQHGSFSSSLHSREKLYYKAIDLFCDYTESSSDEFGRRFYIRQHQLRRWFATVFFWANSFGGAETLRWFLAHTDMQHLYHYVTEAVPGSVLRSAAAAWATAALLAERPETEILARLVRQHFGTQDVRCIDSRRLEVYLEEVIEAGEVKVEPIFFDFGKRCQIGVYIAGF